MHTKTNHYNLTGHPALLSKCFPLRIRYLEYLGLSLVVYHLVTKPNWICDLTSSKH